MKDSLLARLIGLRKRANLSCKELSELIQRQDNYISRVEKGRYPIPPAEDLERIARACGSSMEELFYETFESYYDDKEILEKFKKITPKGRDAIIALMVTMYENEEVA